MWCKSILSISVIACLSSCTTFQAKPFTSSNLDTYKAKNSVKTPIKIAHFTSNSPKKNTIDCRGPGTNIYLPNKTTFVQYMEDSFAEILISAKRYDPKSSVKLYGYFTDFDFSTTSGKWYIKGKFHVNDHAPVTVNGSYDFPTAFAARAACTNAAIAFESAVHQYIYDVLNHKGIKNYLHS